MGHFTARALFARVKTPLNCKKTLCHKTPFLREVVKKRIFYNQADHKRLTLMCSEINFTPEKSFSSNYKNSQLLLTAAAALSQNGQITV